jgi:UDP-N-acetylmuramoylalanine--D-glutamate ligase
LLNLFEEHLDHFSSYEEYICSKYHIASLQSENDTFIYNSDLADIRKLIEKSPLKSQMQTFSKEESLNIEADYLKGEHNLMNIQSALLATQAFGAEKTMALKTAKTFTPLAHRLEFVAEKNGVKYYNDSISTIPQAAIEAIKALKEVQTIILGGMDRGIDYTPLVEEIDKFEIKNIAFVGGAGRRISREMQDKAKKFNTLISDDYSKIVEWCSLNTEKGKICLLSPAASSYDMFKNFEHRGEVFSKLVKEIK